MTRKICNLFSFFIFLFLWTGFIKSQTISSSVYSRYGIGAKSSPLGVRSLSMGKTGIAVPGSKYLNILNPATISSLEYVTIEWGGSYSRTSTENETQYVSKAKTNFDYQTIGIPTNSKIWDFGIGIKPYSSSNYEITTKESVTLDKKNIPYSISQKGSGSINNFFFANSFKLSKWASVGISASYLFGNLKQTRRIRFDSTSSYFISSQAEDDFSLRGFSGNLGFLSHFTMENGNKFSAGLIFSPSTVLTSQRKEVVKRTLDYSVFFDSSYHVSGDNFDTKTPLTYGVGVGYSRRDKFGIYSDFVLENWEKAQIESDVSAEITTGYKFSIGGEWSPRKKNSTRYLDFLMYRAGFYYDKTYLKINTTDIIDMGFTLGLEFPFRSKASVISLNFMFGQKGTVEKNLLLERYFRLGLSLNLSTIWFLTRKID